MRHLPAATKSLRDAAKEGSATRTPRGMIYGNPGKWLEILPFSASFLVASLDTTFPLRKTPILKPFVADMDLVCLIDNKEAALHASDLVAMIGDLLERGKSGRKTTLAPVIDEIMAQKPTLRSSRCPRHGSRSSSLR